MKEEDRLESKNAKGASGLNHESIKSKDGRRGDVVHTVPSWLLCVPWRCLRSFASHRCKKGTHWALLRNKPENSN